MEFELYVKQISTIEKEDEECVKTILTGTKDDIDARLEFKCSPVDFAAFSEKYLIKVGLTLTIKLEQRQKKLE